MIYKNGVYIPPLDDTPVDAETEEGITSNWAYDHKADVDAHVGSGLTTGELLVATGSTTAVWKSTGVVLSAPDISGSVSAASALTLPAFTLGGTVTLGGNIFDAGAGYLHIDTTGGTGLQMAGGIVTGGGAPNNFLQNWLAGVFTSGGGSTVAAKFYLDGRLDGAAGDTTWLTGTHFANTIRTQTAEESIGYVAQVILGNPGIVNNLTGAGVITVASTLYIVGAPTEGATNAAIYVASGDLNLASGNIVVSGTVDGVDVSAHAANTTTAHGAVSAATASKIVVRDASARTKFAQSAATGDAIVADANNRAPDSTLLEGSSKATVQDHTPKAHTIVSHSDTTATGTELETLTDGSETALHSHAAGAIAAHESTHVAGGSDDIDSALADAAIPNLAAGKITSDRFPVDRLPALTDEKIWKGTGGNVEEIDVPVAFYKELTVAIFQETPATGTFNANPGNINNGNVGAEVCTADGVNQYAEIDLPTVCVMKQWRQYGHLGNSGDGVWKLQYYNLLTHAWINWVTGIATRATADWSDWTDSGEVITDKIRMVATTIDTEQNKNWVIELEVKY